LGAWNRPPTRWARTPPASTVEVEAIVMAARVLIWDGPPLSARAMETLLRREGMEIVGVAGETAEAVPAILQCRPDVVVADRIVERDHPLAMPEIIRVFYL